ncbi:MAG TPA: Fic family protein [Desulfosporosinus sp.]|nr:Fic family protein [Desulfosporosinus sp.]
MRSGIYINQPSGYKSFIPNSLPPNPTLEIDQEMLKLIAEANRAIGRLDGLTETLPNPDLFVAMYVKKEAVLSSQIEGTQASLADVLEFESKDLLQTVPDDIGEVVSYVEAINYGLERLKSLPLSLRLIREIHQTLMKNGRGSNCTPGEFRHSQNWIGAAGSTLSTASFVPPPVPEMIEAMGNLEKYIHEGDEILLIKCGLVHCQFETIHPFLDGNGRIGRLLITFLLCEQKALSKPLLYISNYFKANRIEYYDRLMAVRNKGDYEGWIKFFLRGIILVSNQAVKMSRQIVDLQASHHQLVAERVSSPNAYKFLEYLYQRPIISANDIVSALGISFPTANRLISQFCDNGILLEKTGKTRNRIYAYMPYLDVLNEESLSSDNDI